MPKNILFVQRVIAEYRLPLLNYLSCNYNLSVVCGHPYDDTDVRPIKSIPCYIYFDKIVYFLGNRFWLHKNILRLLLKDNWDTIIIQPTPRCLTNFIIIAYCKIMRIKIVGWGMGEMPGRSFIPKLIHRLLGYLVLPHLDKILCYSSVAKKYYINFLFSNQIFIVNNNIEIPHKDFKYIRDDKSVLKILYLGRIIEGKKLHKLVEIALINSFISLEIVGDGCKNYIKKLEDMANSAPNIIFHGYKNMSSVYRFCQKCDYLVLPSRGGLSINHALAYGLPVICSDGDGTEKDLIIPGITGYLFENNNWNQLNKILINCYKNRSNLQNFHRNTYLYYNKNFSFYKMLKSFKYAINV